MESGRPKKDASDTDRRFCICRSKDAKSFMIACDKCEEWFHGKCIKITPEKASNIKRYFCDDCCKLDPQLKIRYKKHKHRRGSEREKGQSDRMERGTTDRGTLDRMVSERGRAEKEYGENGERHRSVTESERFVVGRLEMHSPAEESSFTDDQRKHKLDLKPEESAKSLERDDHSSYSARQDVCSPIDDDSRSALREERHGDSGSKHLPEAVHKKSKLCRNSKKSSRQCGACASCYRTEDCGICDFCRDMRKFGGPNKIRQKCRLRQCRNFGLRKGFDGEPLCDPVPPAPAVKKVNLPLKRPPMEKPRVHSSYIHRKRSHQDRDENIKFEDGNLSQCYGPRCVNSARPKSKYCSDECGMKMAAQRLVEIMPRRIEQWQSSPCMAEERNKKEADEILQKMREAKKRLDELDERHRVIDRIVERAKKNTVLSDSEEDETEDADVFVYCVTCGHEINQRGAIKHMEKCFIKHEREMSFGGAYKSMIGGDMICDHYNAQTRSYCKRIKIICPEHSREPKVSDSETCGCPISLSPIEQQTDELCRVPKNDCVKHYRWEKLRRAEIDAEKIRQWVKLDELCERERQLKSAMANRAGVLGLLLHQTVDHDALKKQQIKALATKDFHVKAEGQL